MPHFRGRSFLILGLSSLVASRTLAQNHMSLADQILPVGSKNETLFVQCAHQATIQGFSLSIRYRPADLSITEVTTSGTSVEKLAFWFLIHDDVKGEIVVGAVLDLTRPLPPAPDHRLARLTFDIKAPAGTTTPVEFFEPPAGAPFNVLTNDLGQSVTPTLKSGSITVRSATGQLPPVADAGPDRVAAELSSLILDGSGSSSFGNQPLTFEWIQVSGLFQATLSDAHSPQPSLLLPSVIGDQPLVFVLSVDDGNTASIPDLVTVTAVDVDLRKGSVRLDPSPASVIDGGSRAIVFEGEVLWDLPAEDALLRHLRFTASGGGDESQLLGEASLHIDENGNGSLDAPDREVGRVSIPSDNAPVAFDFLARVKTGPGKRFFLVVDLKSSTPGQAVLVLLPGLLLLWGLGRLLRGKAGERLLLLTVLLILPIFAHACGGGGGGGGGAGAAAREVRFELRDVGLQGALTGVPGTVTGVPIQGPPLQI